MEQTRNSIRGVLPKPVHTAPTRYRDPQTGQTMETVRYQQQGS